MADTQKYIQVNVRITEQDYKKLTIRAIQESTKSNELISVLDIVRMLIQKYLNEKN